MQYFAPGRTHESMAYENEGARVNACIFALYVIAELSEHWNVPEGEVYQRLMDSNLLEDYLFYYHNSLHQEPLQKLLDTIDLKVSEQEVSHR